MLLSYNCLPISFTHLERISHAHRCINSEYLECNSTKFMARMIIRYYLELWYENHHIHINWMTYFMNIWSWHAFNTRIPEVNFHTTTRQPTSFPVSLKEYLTSHMKLMKATNDNSHTVNINNKYFHYIFFFLQQK